MTQLGIERGSKRKGERMEREAGGPH